MSVIARLDGLQQRHRVLGLPIAVFYKFFDDQGGNLAALVAYYAFLSLFPLLLVLSTVLGLVLDGHPGLQRDVLDSALGQFPALGDDLRTPGRIGGGTLGLVVGLVVALYGGLGVASALQNAMNVAWTVRRNERPNPFKLRLISLQLLGTVGLAVIATAALAAIANGAGGLADQLGVLFRIAVVLAAVALNGLIFSAAFRLATARDLTRRQVRPGAVTAAVLWQLLQAVGAAYVRRVSGADTATAGVFGVVLGLLAFLYLASTLVVLCVEINVVLVLGLHPRALLTPFTDAVQLTEGDETAYTRQAEAQAAKGFESIAVSFDEEVADPPPHPDGS